MRETAFSLLKTALAALIIIPLGVGIGKAIEYGTVDLLGDRLGFDGAALLGTAVFVALALFGVEALDTMAGTKKAAGSLRRPFAALGQMSFSRRFLRA